MAVPPLRNVATLPAMVTTLVFRLVKATGNPLLEVADNVNLLFGPNTWLLNASKVIVWSAMSTVSVRVVPAGLKLALPALVAVSVTDPAPLIVPKLLTTLTTAGLALTNPTGNPELLLPTRGKVALLEKTCADGCSKPIVCGALAITSVPAELPW